MIKVVLNRLGKISDAGVADARWIGRNYLDLYLDTRAPDGLRRLDVVRGIRRVLQGQLAVYETDYELGVDGLTHVFRIRAERVTSNNTVIVSHDHRVRPPLELVHSDAA